jgi:hypothetical protein
MEGKTVQTFSSAYHNNFLEGCPPPPMREGMRKSRMSRGQGGRASKLWLRCLRNEISLKGGNLQGLEGYRGALLKNYVPNTEQVLKRDEL